MAWARDAYCRPCGHNFGRVEGLRPLPSREVLTSAPHVEASALRALNMHADERVAVILHADDPVFLASSAGACQALLADVAEWAFRHKAAFHTAMCVRLGYRLFLSAFYLLFLSAA